MPHPLRTTVEDFVEGLKAFERPDDHITTERVRSYIDSTRLSARELQPFIHFRDDFYTRNLVYRDRLFEVMVICWKAGQKTAIHTHNGQLGWMTVPQGEVAVHNYKYVSCNAPENQNVVGMDCLGGASHIELDRLSTHVCANSAPIYTVDKLQTIHQIENTDPSGVGVVSLHVYSMPFDSCIAFDLDKQRCFRRTLHYYSRYGKVEVEAEQSASGELKII
jgi:predicted metal-dependent enzyme (double-stranded beta helix superfamily)